MTTGTAPAASPSPPADWASGLQRMLVLVAQLGATLGLTIVAVGSIGVAGQLREAGIRGIQPLEFLAHANLLHAGISVLAREWSVLLILVVLLAHATSTRMLARLHAVGMDRRHASILANVEQATRERRAARVAGAAVVVASLLLSPAWWGVLPMLAAWGAVLAASSLGLLATRGAVFTAAGIATVFVAVTTVYLDPEPIPTVTLRQAQSQTSTDVDIATGEFLGRGDDDSWLVIVHTDDRPGLLAVSNATVKDASFGEPTRARSDRVWERLIGR